MKSIKLKPLFFPSDDILVVPPEILNQTNNFPEEKVKNKTLSSSNQLISILRGRRLKKQNLQKKVANDEEKETVKKLSEWKRNNSPKSPIMRRYTFKRTFTLNNITNEQRSPTRTITKLEKIIPVRLNTLESLINGIYSILTTERFKKRVQDEEIKKISERNQDYERQVNDRIIRASKEISGLKDFIRDNTAQLEQLKKEKEDCDKAFEQKCINFSTIEAHELMLRDKEKGRKSFKPSEEKEYFIKKEKLRQAKHEIHKKYQEENNRIVGNIENLIKTIEQAEYQRTISKKELKEYQEQIVMLYCRALRDGKDLRSDGLRWVIKALWAMNEPIPLSAFPKFIDEESIQFLLEIAEKDVEIEMYERELERLRTEVKNQRPSSTAPSTRNLYRDVKQRLRDISQSSVGKPAISPSYTEETEISQKSYSKLETNIYTGISELRDKIYKIHELVKEMTNNEIKRVTESYQPNQSGEEEIGIMHIIRCLVGDKVREFNKYTRSLIFGNKSKAFIKL
ncbi:hypothetical protein SteCoe_19088 [Stentor coeruleus]|uniref:Uncharacterized protein n=1 Tax=Stentor coeruleus TaxID=5963 RepID=A0A1R2BV15_9CILI|nr:hypothetical protein SteCoe_19088 [Stentor coeruleus]